MDYTISAVDAASLSEAGAVHAEAWRESHRAFCSPEFLALHTAKRQTRYLAEKLAGGSQLYLMRLGSRAVGVVSVTGSLIEDLYILPPFQNRGLGTILLRHAIRQCGAAPTLWILENNAGAERLYRREGFLPTGRRNAITEELSEIEMLLQGNHLKTTGGIPMNHIDPTCAYCAHGEPLAKFGIYIYDLTQTRLYLFKEQSHPGRVIVANKDHVSDITDLSDEERNAFFADVARVSRALKAAFHPDRINYGAYNDNGIHLHYHLVPKYRDGFEWGSVFAMNPGLVQRTDAEYAALIDRIKAEL